MTTKVIDNFGGKLTRFNFGSMNSGFVKFFTSFCYEPFGKPNQLTWQETATQIDEAGAVITDLIMDGKERVESGISYVYAIGHTGRLYKIQVNDPTTYNPNYDNPVLLATLTSNSPTFTRGGSIDFYGSTERIYIGHDKGVTRIDFNGANETFVGVLGSWVQNVPRPLKQFLGKLYVGNGPNLAEIDSTATVTTYTKLTPGFPDNTQVRDIDISPDGNYIQTVVSRLDLPDITVTTQDTTFLTNSESYIFKWNGVDLGYTSFDSFPSFSLNSNIMFGNYQYTFGYDLTGASIYNPVDKLLSPVLTQVPLPNAISSSGNLVGWDVPEFSNGFLRFTQFLYGNLDKEFEMNWYRTYAQTAQGTETDVIRTPWTLLVSNFVLSTVTSGYASGVVGMGKQYFSTLETSPSPTTKYKLYKYFPVPIGTGTAAGGVYETLTEMFSKRIRVKEIRIYGNPWVANNSFKIDLIGPDGAVITNSSKTFTAGSSLSVGEDFAWYNPAIQPSYAIGVRITNLGTANHVINKIELDITEGGE